ncbi:hypothetical protein [Amphritea sp. HPY]|uniref:hypothetical protein n=1 Tax=Amphritea sp. HPY TaxID=3421652 RepID=UPI003D7C9DCB
MKTTTLGRIPVLKDECQLYFDGKHDRWVLKAPQQAVFLDKLTLLVLQACDGYCSEQQIIASVATFPELGGISERDVSDILAEFEQRGFIQVQAA